MWSEGQNTSFSWRDETHSSELSRIINNHTADVGVNSPKVGPETAGTFFFCLNILSLEPDRLDLLQEFAVVDVVS